MLISYLGTQELGDGNPDMPIQQQQQMISSNMLIQNPNNMNNLAADLSSSDWIWDVGFPSLLPMVLDSFHLQPPFEGGLNATQ
jgi:hypothetical protein